jgi:hypothetical protein
MLWPLLQIEERSGLIDPAGWISGQPAGYAFRSSFIFSFSRSNVGQLQL